MVARRIIAFFPGPVTTAAPTELSSTNRPRKHEVLDLIAAGYSNADVAAALVLSPKTAVTMS